MLKPNDIYRKVEDKWVSRFILDEVVIMPLCRSQEDMQYIYSISNETGSMLWQLLDGGHSVSDIQEILKSEYQGQKEVIEREVLEFIGDIFEAGLVEEAGEKRGRRRQTINDQRGAIDRKKPYKTPEIVKVKMQPEQAVLSCCIDMQWPKRLGGWDDNWCVTPMSCEIVSGLVCGPYGIKAGTDTAVGWAALS